MDLASGMLALKGHGSAGRFALRYLSTRSWLKARRAQPIIVNPQPSALDSLDAPRWSSTHAGKDPTELIRRTLMIIYIQYDSPYTMYNRPRHCSPEPGVA